MKTVRMIVLRLIGITLVLSSCSTKQLSTQLTKLSEHQTEHTRVRSRGNRSYRNDQVITWRDSADQYYRVNIFPLDTFSLTPGGGFRGAASSVELIGRAHQVRSGSDRTASREKITGEIHYDHMAGKKVKAAESAKVLEKEKRAWLPGSVWILLLFGIFWGWIKFRKRG